MSRLDNVEPTDDFSFHYSFLRCSLDVVEFMMYYLRPQDEGNRRNYICHKQTDKPTTYKELMDIIQQSIQQLLKKDPTANQRFNSNLFITLHLLNKIKFEE